MSDSESLPSDIEEQALKAISGLLPEKSRAKYEIAYAKYEKWCTEKKIHNHANEKQRGDVNIGIIMNSHLCSPSITIQQLEKQLTKAKMAESDNAWVFDSLVCFLNGPVWNAPLQSFIEEKSLIFEANTSDNVEYHKIFEEYKNLVDLMLGSYMEDIGITPSQFEEACNKGHLEFVPKNFDHSLFEQIWAANDYEMFKRMMTQRNVELQLQALELIEQKYGVTPQSFIPHKGAQPHVTGETTAEISSETHDKAIDLEEEIMEEVIKQFPYEDATATLQEPSKVDEEVLYLQEEKQILRETLKSIEENAKAQGDFLPIKSNEEESSAPEVKASGAEENKTENKEADVPTRDEIAFDKKPISAEIDRIELKKRQEYLRAQRDKLVALKKEARKKHLDVDVTKDKLKNRPKSAKAAEAVMTGNSANIEHQQLQVRKALAERLKSEVISGKTEEN